MVPTLDSIRAAAVGIAIFNALAICTGLIGANVRQLAAAKGWDSHFLRTWDYLPAASAKVWPRLRTLWWAWLYLGLSAGLGIALSQLDQNQPSQQPATTTYELTPTQVSKLADEFFIIKNVLPPVVDVQRLDTLETAALTLQLLEAFARAGVRTTLNFNSPLTPTGVTIRVGNLQSIPEGARKIATTIKDIAGIEPVFTLLPGTGPMNFMIFIGPKPRQPP
jgi:hypothetical protein